MKMRLASGEARSRSSISSRLAAIRRSASGWIGMSLVERLLEEAQDVDRVLAEGGLVDEVEPAVLQPVAGAGRVLAEGEDGAELLAEARASA